MKISVLTPTYNDCESIRETIQSLISQTYTDWEWIVINDGSTDHTDDVMQKLIAEYHLEDKCKYIKQENADQLNALLNGCNYITGKYVFILHSDDLLPSQDFFEKCIQEMQKDDTLEGLFGDLVVINGESKVTGIQTVREYDNSQHEPALLLLWLGRNLYADFAFHKAESFLSRVKENYLTWNMPFWLYYEDGPKMVNYKKADFPVLQYRVHGGNYINNEIGVHNVLNGELRTAIKLMRYYTIPNYQRQYVIYRVFNKLNLANLFHVKYQMQESQNKADMIDFIIRKRFSDYKDKIYFYSIYQFYKNKQNRTVDLSQIPADIRTYCGKDMRTFNKKLLAGTLEKEYLWFMQEMQEGFDTVVGYDHLGTQKVQEILKFFCIEEEVRDGKGTRK